jgi:hypothetical protein
VKRSALLRRTPFLSQATERAPRERQLCRLVRVPAPFEHSFNPVPKGDFDELDAYRAWVKTFACFGCNAPAPSDCCHANEGKGMGLKVSDRRVFPLCRHCHEHLDQSRGMTREERRQRERRYVDRMQEIARSEKRKEFEAKAPT